MLIDICDNWRKNDCRRGSSKTFTHFCPTWAAVIDLPKSLIRSSIKMRILISMPVCHSWSQCPHVNKNVPLSITRRYRDAKNGFQWSKSDVCYPTRLEYHQYKYIKHEYTCVYLQHLGDVDSLSHIYTTRVHQYYDILFNIGCLSIEQNVLNKKSNMNSIASQHKILATIFFQYLIDKKLI